MLKTTNPEDGATDGPILRPTRRNSAGNVGYEATAGSNVTLF